MGKRSQTTYVILGMICLTVLVLLLVWRRKRHDPYENSDLSRVLFGTGGSHPNITPPDLMRKCSKRCGCTGMESYGPCQDCVSQCSCANAFINTCLQDGHDESYCSQMAEKSCVPQKVWYREEM
jgi:LPXTG-motif cell wall-anchored protein